MSTQASIMSADAIRRALTLRDLTDPAQGPHAMQLLVDGMETALAERWGIPARRERAHPIVSIEENYDLLLVAADAVAREARYTRYLSERTVLRTHTSAMVPPLLQRLAAEPPRDVVLSCPGIVYRRDRIDRQSVGEPHQLDLWRVRTVGPPLDRAHLVEMIETVVEAAMPGHEWRTTPTGHSYTEGGVQIDVRDGEAWIEIGECGTAHPDVLQSSGLPVPPTSGLAMGLGLDRILMIRKGIDDIRLLRAEDPRISAQMLDLKPYRAVSAMPPARRDLSVAVASTVAPEDLGDRIRAALAEEAASVELVEVLSETPYDELPAMARRRLGIREGQKNLLIRVWIRHLERTLTDEEANRVRDRIYAAIHEGDEWTWASGDPMWRPLDHGGGD